MVRNYVDETPLHLAAREGKLNIVTILVITYRVEIDQDTVVQSFEPNQLFRMGGLPRRMPPSMASRRFWNFWQNMKPTLTCQTNLTARPCTGLLRLGAEFDSVDFEGKKATDIAIEYDFKDMVTAVQ
jgi:Ankyrin repeat